MEANSLDAEALERLHLVSSKWVLPLLLVLNEDSKRYTDIEAALPGISPRALTDKLRLLKSHGYVKQVERRGYGRSRLYSLTENGEELATAAQELASWAYPARFSGNGGP